MQVSYWIELAALFTGLLPPFPSLFPLFYQCDRFLLSSPSTRGLMAGLPGVADCQYWKLLDVSGTQPPLARQLLIFEIETLASYHTQRRRTPYTKTTLIPFVFTKKLLLHIL